MIAEPILHTIYIYIYVIRKSIPHLPPQLSFLKRSILWLTPEYTLPMESVRVLGLVCTQVMKGIVCSLSYFQKSLIVVETL